MIEYDIAGFGGQGDGVTDNTGFFNTALRQLTNGGLLRIGKGIWRTGPLELPSNTTLLLEKGAVLSFIPEPERYTPVFTRWEGADCYSMRPCLFANGQDRITITGGGVLNGNGQIWWETLSEKRSAKQQEPETPEELRLAELNPGYNSQPGGGGGRVIQFLRPPLVQFLNCQNIRIEGVALRNSPFWTLHPVYCKGVTVSGVSINNPKDAPNTDGIDIDSSEDVLVENCHISVGDDAIAVKSGSGEDGIRRGRSSRNITVRGCTVEEGHGGIVIGSETAGGIYNVLAENCLFRGTDRGIRIKTRRGRGGQIHNLAFKNLKIENNLCPLAINMYYRCGAAPEDDCFGQEARPVNALTPSIKNVLVSGITAKDCKASAGFIAGLPESPVENILLENCEISTDESSGVSPDESDMFYGLPKVSGKGMRLLNIKNAELKDVHISGPAESFIYS